MQSKSLLYKIANPCNDKESKNSGEHITSYP